MGKVKNYSQKDPRWGNKTYCGMTMADAGCGATASADIIHSVNFYVTPWTCAKWLSKHGYAAYNQGTAWVGIKKLFEAYRMECVWDGANHYGDRNSEAEKNWLKLMASGDYYGILLMGKSIFTNSGHYIAIVGYDKTKGVYVYDPYSPSLCGWRAWGDFDGKVKCFYAVKKKKTPRIVKKGSLNGFKVGKAYTAKSDRYKYSKPKKAKKNRVRILSKGRNTGKVTAIKQGTARTWIKDGKHWHIAIDAGNVTQFK